MSLDKDIDRLRRIPMFSVMDHDALRLMAFAAEKRAVGAGDVLFRQGETGDAAYLVISGAIALSSGEAEKAEIRTLGPGSLIGEQALLAPARRPVTAAAPEPSSVLAITRSLFTRVLQEHPSSAKAVRRFWAKGLAERLSVLKG